MSDLPADWSFPCTPQPPDWRLDWRAVQERFAWIRAMEGVPQDPAHHAEGDVLTHTGMVAEALTHSPEWRALPAVERALLFASALLHDVAKPLCTQTEPDGNVTAKGHAHKGEKVARRLLWSGEDSLPPAPFSCREAIAKLTRHHGLPLWFLEKPNPEPAVLGASLTVRLNWVALLAEADAQGRECADKNELLERVELFRLYCQERDCYSRPFAFASDQSRYAYFHSESPQTTYHPHDLSELEVVLMSGLPGSGKDTWVQSHLPALPVISLDAIRREMRISPTAPQDRVIQAARVRAKDLLRQKQPFVWNATNVTRLVREPLIEQFVSHRARVRLVYLDAPLPLLLLRNRRRDSPVPESVILRLMDKLEIPDLTEAHQVETALSAR